MQFLIGYLSRHNVKNPLLMNSLEQKRYTILHALGPEGLPTSVEAGYLQTESGMTRFR